MSTLKPYHHGDLRAALVETTFALVRERGVAALSLREVSRRAGVSHTAAYNHFPDKAALVSAFVEAAFERFAAELQAARARGTSPLDSLRRVGVAYVSFAHAHPQEFKIMFRPELSRAGTLDAKPAAETSYRVLRDSIATALAAGDIRGDEEALIRVSWAVVHGLAALIVDGPSGRIDRAAADVERVTNESVVILIDGMRARYDAPSHER